VRTYGIVPWLNAVPLTAGLERDARLVADLPSALARRLDAGEVDAALVPIAEAIRGVGDGFLGGHGIGSEGPVASVLLWLRKPLAEVRTVLLDPASRTSAVLARWVVGPDAAYRTPPVGGHDPARAGEDAVLVIGDPALRLARKVPAASLLDLGAEWTRRTRLPFVFARWTARRGLSAAERSEIAAQLDRAADEGLPARGALATAWAQARGEDAARAREYLQRFVRYRIGPREEEAIARFAEVVREQEPVRA
jgi:chorismate dehydratase